MIKAMARILGRFGWIGSQWPEFNWPRPQLAKTQMAKDHLARTSTGLNRCKTSGWARRSSTPWKRLEQTQLETDSISFNKKKITTATATGTTAVGVTTAASRSRIPQNLPVSCGLLSGEGGGSRQEMQDHGRCRRLGSRALNDLGTVDAGREHICRQRVNLTT